MKQPKMRIGAFKKNVLLERDIPLMTIDCKYISPPTSNSQMEFSEQCPFFSASRLFTSGATLDIQTTVATVVVSLHISLFWIGLDDKHRNPNFNKEEEKSRKREGHFIKQP